MAAEAIVASDIEIGGKGDHQSERQTRRHSARRWGSRVDGFVLPSDRVGLVLSGDLFCRSVAA